MVGGGVIGLSIAWRLAQRGAAVTVVDPAPGGAASNVAAGMLAPVSEAHYEEESILGLNLESARRWPEFAAEVEAASGIDVAYRASGTLVVAADAGDAAWLADLQRFQSGLGLSAQRLTSRECREREPSLAPGIRGGVLVEDDHQVDPRRLVRALLEACRRAGVSLCAGRVEELQLERGRCVGVRLTQTAPTADTVPIGTEGALQATTVVLAAGSWSSRLAEGPGLPSRLLPPIRPVKGQILRLRERRSGRTGTGEPPLISANVRGIVEGSSVYLVPREDGELVVGATVEEQGYDTTVTAGAVLDLLRDAYALVPEVAELELVESLAGLRPCSPDNAPVIGPTALDGLVAATGHYRNGVLLTPVTADLVADIVIHGTVPDLARAFSAARFEDIAA